MKHITVNGIGQDPIPFARQVARKHHNAHPGDTDIQVTMMVNTKTTRDGKPSQFWRTHWVAFAFSFSK